jgi:GntR family transcriptional regulator
VSLLYIRIDLEGKDPIYTQLKNQIIAGVARGDLKPGESLPSVRAMAADIGINLHTVNKAYQQLKQEGVILIHRQKGVVVNPDGVEPADEDYLSNLKQTLHPLIAEAVCRSVSEKEFLTMCKELFVEFPGGKDDR